VDLCENDKSLADLINVNGTSNVVNACKKIGSKIIYVSTSNVFDGKNQKYTEADKPNPTTHYGITKLLGEDLVKDSGMEYMILRTDQPYCWIKEWQHTNSVLRVLDKLVHNETLNEITDWYNTPTYVPDFIKVLFSLISKNAQGIFHLTGSEFVSRFEWSLQVAETFRLDKNLILPIHSDLLKLPVKRPNVYLSNDKAFKYTGIRMAGITEGLNNMKSEIKQIKHSKYQDLLNT
jgi:dTDP-4-dehydrorhamnose reductase